MFSAVIAFFPLINIKLMLHNNSDDISTLDHCMADLYANNFFGGVKTYKQKLWKFYRNLWGHISKSETSLHYQRVIRYDSCDLEGSY